MEDRAGLDSGPGPGPADGVVDAARAALSERLQSIPKLLRRAARRGGERPEAVHRLRVATRRASAALEAFSPLIIDEKARRSIEKTLRRARRAAGPARACDVHLAQLNARLAARPGQEACAAIGALMVRVVARRDRAQRTLRRYSKSFSRSEFDDDARRVIESVSDCGAGVSAGAWAGVCIRAVLEDVRALDRKERLSNEQWHELRLALKRVRYQIELFGALTDAGTWKGMLEHASVLQDRLGEMNDLEELAALITAEAESLSHGAGGTIARGLEAVASGVRADRERIIRDAGRAWGLAGPALLRGVPAADSTPGTNGPMMDLDAAMESALERAREVLRERGEAG